MELLEWLLLDQVVRDEVVQAREEGKELESVDNDYLQALNLSGQSRKEKLKQLYARLGEARTRPDYPYSEPSEISEILAARPSVASTTTALDLNIGKRDDLFDRIHGAWLGRCVGCLLGKPIEGMTPSQVARMIAWKGYEVLDFYISREGGLPPDFEMDSEQVKRYDTGVFENVLSAGHMLRDDDIDYTLIGLHVLERYGRSFDALNIGATWLERMPLLMTYTAERVAYRNLALGMSPPRTAIFENPYREWIGAQIRGDIWGYVNPGNPVLAAEYAYRDSIVSHQKNGIYGEMFVAATISAAFCVDSIGDAIERGLNQIPETSRLTEAIRNVIIWCKSDKTWRETLERIMKLYGSYNWFHTIPNAAIVVMALLHGKGDFARTVGIAVMAGLDTDCNGATTGSILGTFLGASRLPKKWVEPLNDRISTAVVGMSDTGIAELADRTLSLVGKKVSS
jgi:ADP-ribosylglycohydrolase